MALDDAKAVDGDRGEVGVELLGVTEQAERRSMRTKPTSNKPVIILVYIVRVFGYNTHAQVRSAQHRYGLRDVARPMSAPPGSLLRAEALPLRKKDIFPRKLKFEVFITWVSAIKD